MRINILILLTIIVITLEQFVAFASITFDSFQIIDCENMSAPIKNEIDSPYNQENEINVESKTAFIKEETTLESETIILHLILILIFALTVVIVIRFHIRKRQQLYDKMKDREEMLMTKNEELSQTVDLKNKFLTIISHDLKGPVSSLNQLMKALLLNYNQLNNEDVKRYLTNAGKTSGRLDCLLHNLLTWSRLQDNQLNPVMDNYDINHIINEEINNLESQYKTKNIDMVNKIPKRTIIYADKHMISLVIRNILHNAIKFSFENGKIETEIKEMNKHKMLSIKDNGIGISNQIKDKIFDVCYKTSIIGTAGEKGTGLGLNLAKEFIRLHNGDIWFDTAENEGTTFYIKLLKYDEGKYG